MTGRNIADLADSGMARGCAIFLSLALACAYIVSPLGLGLNPFARPPRILAVLGEDLVRKTGTEPSAASFAAGTLVEVAAAGDFGALVRAAKLDDSKPGSGLLRLPAGKMQALKLVSAFRVKSDVTSKERPDALALDGPRLAGGSTAVARSTARGWVELRSGNRWVWAPVSSVATLNGTAGGEVPLYKAPSFDDKRGVLPRGAAFQVLGQYKDAYLISCKEPPGLFWAPASGVEVR